jgi:selenium-binding protein 1
MVEAFADRNRGLRETTGIHDPVLFGRRGTMSIANLKPLVSTIAGVLLLGLSAAAGEPMEGHGLGDAEGRYLYVWAGDMARTHPDFLAVVNFDPLSRAYGGVIRAVPLPPPGNVGNEPHHIHLSPDGNTLAAGGLLSLLSNEDPIFFFDVRNPERPRFLKSTRASLSSITDAFAPLSSGGFLVTQMGSNTGGTPGRVAEFDKHLNLVKEWPEEPPPGFNPHGISLRPELNLMVTSDFVDPASTLDTFVGPPQYRNTIRVWDLRRRQIVQTITVPSPGVGTMEVKLIPRDHRGRAYTPGLLDGLLYLVDPINGTAHPVFDFATLFPHGETPNRGGAPQLVTMTRDGSRMFIGLFESGQVVMLDTSNPEHPWPLSVVNLGRNAGTHSVELSPDERRVVVSDYFLSEDMFGKVHLEGDHRIRVLNVSRIGMVLDHRFDLDFNTAFPTGPARPHGMAIK